MLNLTPREEEVLRLLSEEGDLSVRRLSAQLNVSEVTVRADLNALAEKGFVVRTRGGALPAFHPSISARLSDRAGAQRKERLARAAAGHVSNGDNVMLVAGTTAGMIVRFLLGKQDVHLVTNSTLVLPYARINPALRVTFVGGEFCPSGEAMVGPIALRELRQFHVKTAFIGADGFSLATGVTAHLVDLAEVVKTMAAQAEQTILVADSSKYGHSGFAHILPLSEVDLVITDEGLTESARAELEEAGIALQIV